MLRHYLELVADEQNIFLWNLQVGLTATCDYHYRGVIGHLEMCEETVSVMQALDETSLAELIEHTWIQVSNQLVLNFRCLPCKSLPSQYPKSTSKA